MSLAFEVVVDTDDLGWIGRSSCLPLPAPLTPVIRGDCSQQVDTCQSIPTRQISCCGRVAEMQGLSTFRKVMLVAHLHRDGVASQCCE